MPIVLQQFSKGPLTVAQLNALVAAIEAKFAAGVTGSDLAWPFEAQGNIDMGHYELLNVAEFWKVRNLADRDVAGGVSVQNVFDEVRSAGGGAIYLPGDSIESIGSEGVTVGANTIVYGAGASSVFAAATSMSNSMFRSHTADQVGVEFYNLRFDGVVVGAGAHPGIEFIQADNGRVVNCEFEGFIGAHIRLGTDSTGFPTEHVTVSGCRFLTPVSGAGVQQIEFGEASRCHIVNSEFILPRAGCIGMGNIQSRDNVISNCLFVGSAINLSAAIQLVAGVSATSTEDTKVLNCTFDGGSSDSHMYIIVSGHNDSVISGNTFRDGTGNDAAITVLTNNGAIITNNSIHDWAGNGITLSIDNSVSAVTNASGTSDILIGYNSIHATTAGNAGILWHVASASSAIRIVGNSVDAVEGIALWNLAGGPPTTHNFLGSVMANNNCQSTRGLACYSDAGSTAGGRIGGAVNSNFAIMGNYIPGTQVGAAGTDDITTTAGRADATFISGDLNIV